MKYEKKQIGELVSLRQGFAINKKTDHHMSEEPTQLHLLRIGDMKDGIFSVFVRDTIPEKFIAKESDIIYTRTGQVGLVFRNQHGVVHNNCFTVTSNDESILNQQFLYYALQEKSFYEEANSRATGAAQPDLPHGAFNSIEMFLPPIEKQYNIVSILDSYNGLIENDQKQIKLLEEAAQRLYKEWFVDLHFPGYEDVEIVDGLPQGWKWAPFSDAFGYIRGRSYTSKQLVEQGGIMMVNLKNVDSFGGYKRNVEKRYIGNYKDDQILHPGDIVMGVTDMTKERRLVGHVAIIPDLGEEMTFSMDLIKLIPKLVTHSYLYSAMRFGYYSRNISQLANGVNVLHLKPDSMMNMEILIPSSDVMNKYELAFDAYNSRIDLLEKQIDFASEARDRLLPKLMSGEIEV